MRTKQIVIINQLPEPDALMQQMVEDVAQLENHIKRKAGDCYLSGLFWQRYMFRAVVTRQQRGQQILKATVVDRRVELRGPRVHIHKHLVYNRNGDMMVYHPCRLIQLFAEGDVFSDGRLVIPPSVTLLIRMHIHVDVARSP